MNAREAFTEILGFSQTYQWYTGQPFEYPISEPTFKPQQSFLDSYRSFDHCQARFGFGGDLTKWKDPSFVGYEGHVTHNIMKERDEITRLIFNVSGEARTVAEWKADIEDVVKILIEKYTHLQELALQPVIGGVDYMSHVRAVQNQPQIVVAIHATVNSSAPGLLSTGAIVKLKNEGFSDMIGHLTISGAEEAKERILKFYAISTAP
jgi:hypothetical protein